MSVLLSALAAAHAALYTFTLFDVPDASATLACGINDKEQIVGFYTLPDHNERHSLLYADGAFISLEVPNAGR